ncbi:MAG: tetratricopeptide repeat protein, partial [Proteobacteria bacterium]
QSTQLGETHTLLSRAYGALGQVSKQTEQVQQAVAIFVDSDDTAQAVDALMELAYLYKKSGDFQAAINTYEQAADRAQQGDDPVGQMMAINNLAATYLVMNDEDHAHQLLQQGLDLSLDIGEGRYIASAYSMMSQIYLQKNQPQKAIGQLQEALKYQLKSNSGRGLNPKLMTLNYLLVVTFQSQQASELLQRTQAYVEGLNQASPMAVVQLYQGMNLAHQQQWQASAEKLQSAWQSSQVNNFSYQQPLLLAYFALSHARSEQPIKAIEAAQKVLALDEAEAQQKALAQVALSWAYLLLDNPSQYQQALTEINEADINAWLFVAQQYWQLKLKTTAKTALSYDDYQSQLKEIFTAQQDLRVASQVDNTVLNNLKDKIQQLIVEINKSQTEELTEAD